MPGSPVIISNRWHLDGWDDPPDNSVTGIPARRAPSLRRTSHLNVTWPEGHDGPTLMIGGARDLRTSKVGAPEVVDEVRLQLEVGDRATISSISVQPDPFAIKSLIGATARGFTARLDDSLQDDKESASALYSLLQDFPMLTRIGGMAWTQHRPHAAPDGEVMSRLWREGQIHCSGLRPAGYNHQSNENGIMFPHHFRAAGDLTNPDDPWAWHEIDPAPAVCMRRRRRVDVWPSTDAIEVDAHYRDSLWGPEHDELALHEYTVRASIDAESARVRSVTAIGAVLPFPECPEAAPHVEQLIGLEVTGLRANVQETLNGLHCCTHLNDMLRGLSDVPSLAARLN